MKLFQIFAAAVVFGAALPACAQHSCTQASVYESVEVADNPFSLADILETACPSLQAAAARVVLGGIPSSGSARVIEGSKVRQLLLELWNQLPHGSGDFDLRIPERITIRRGGDHISCSELARALAQQVKAQGAFSTPADIPPLGPEDFVASRMDCRAAAGISRDAALELTKTSWNSALGSWEFSLRCIRTADCVPFLVRLRGADIREAAAASKRNFSAPLENRAVVISPNLRPTEKLALASKALVIPGQAVSLVWDQAGIRITFPAICLDRGGAGEAVRVRAKNGGKIWRAEVADDGTLRAIL